MDRAWKVTSSTGATAQRSTPPSCASFRRILRRKFLFLIPISPPWLSQDATPPLAGAGKPGSASTGRRKPPARRASRSSQRSSSKAVSLIHWAREYSIPTSVLPPSRCGCPTLLACFLARGWAQDGDPGHSVTPELARFIHDHEDTKGLFCYKHVAET